MNHFLTGNKFYILAIVLLVLSFFISVTLLEYMANSPSKTVRIAQHKNNLDRFGSVVFVLPLFPLIFAYLGFRAKESKSFVFIIFALIVFYYSAFFII